MTQAQNTTDSWSEFRERLRSSVSKSNWDTWLSRLEPDFEGDIPVLIAPTEFHLRWVRDKHGDLVQTAYRSAYDTEELPVYRVSETAPAEQPLPLGEPLSEEPSPTTTEATPSGAPSKATNLISR